MKDFVCLKSFSLIVGALDEELPFWKEVSFEK